MITTKDLQEAIAECHGERNPNAQTCIKLAAYYTILDHLGETQGYSFAPRKESGSEFVRAAVSAGFDRTLEIMDDLMQALNVINPRLYSGVMRKLKE